jgi:hypothetical protein
MDRGSSASVAGIACRNIARLGDVCGWPAARLVDVLIHIWPDEAHPLSGRVARDGQEPRRFTGWLQLLSILSEWLDPERTTQPAEDDGDR